MTLNWPSYVMSPGDFNLCENVFFEKFNPKSLAICWICQPQDKKRRKNEGLGWGFPNLKMHGALVLLMTQKFSEHYSFTPGVEQKNASRLMGFQKESRFPGWEFLQVPC